ncbi:hypothetical protein MHU86_15161 [Fragilaria crotonensis]|nr:hypothetical protein MHU86_15161 [Fragilaria crotonensis]
MHRFVKACPSSKSRAKLRDVNLSRRETSESSSRDEDNDESNGMLSRCLDRFWFHGTEKPGLERHNNLVGLNGETCYVLLTDHYSGRLFGRAFATKAPPIEWINSWLASNALNAPTNMSAWTEAANWANVARSTELSRTLDTRWNSQDQTPHTKMDLVSDLTKPLAMPSNHALRCGPSAKLLAICVLSLHPLVQFRPSRRSAFKSVRDVWRSAPKPGKAPHLWLPHHVRPTTARYGRVVPNSRLGVFLGYSRS